ncbi:kinase-like domain-containing protein [Dichotomocladium elegans]|nr:kinase-like domain-containing protein [Dichotomocladium elegans]
MGPRVYDDPISDFFLSSSHIDDNIHTERIPSPDLIKRLQNWQKVRPSFLNRTPRLLTVEYFANNGPLDCMREDEWEEMNDEEDAFRETYLETNYKLLYTLGSGVFADVYEALHLESNANVAIKKTKDPFDSYDDRWLQIIEVDHMQAIKKNRHCIQIRSAWEQSGFLHLEMELCQSGSLRQYIDEHNQMIPEDSLWAIVYEIALGLKAIHDADIIHLDLKPSNILIDEQGFIKIGDFGKSVRVPVDRTWVKGEGDRRYMAPDLLRDLFHKPADVFSLGMIVLEMATGKKLPDMGEPWEQLRLADYSDCEQELASKSTEMQDFIKWLLEMNWRERPTIDQVLEHPQIRKQKDQQQDDHGVLYDYVQILKTTNRFPYHRVISASSPEQPLFLSPEY